MGFGIGEFEPARQAVQDELGMAWARRMYLLAPALSYGASYRRLVWEHWDNAVRAVRKGEPESADYWWERACCAYGMHLWTVDWSTCRRCGAQYACEVAAADCLA